MTYHNQASAKFNSAIKTEPLPLPPGEFDAYLFDCDGTLADTMPLHYGAWLYALKPWNCPFPEPLFYQMGGTPTMRIVELLNQRFQLAMPVEETVHRKETFFLADLKKITPIPSVTQIALNAPKHFPMAVVSGGLRNLVEQTLEFLDLRHLFPILIAAEDVRYGKPSPEPFLLAAEQLGIEPSRCLVFEDSPTGVEAAKAAGMQYVVVPSPAIDPT